MVRFCEGFSYKNTHGDVLEAFAVSDLFIVGAVQSEEFDDVGSPKLSLVLDVGDGFEFEGWDGGEDLRGEGGQDFGGVLLKFGGVFFVCQLCALELYWEGRFGNSVPELGASAELMGLDL